MFKKVRIAANSQMIRYFKEQGKIFSLMDKFFY